MKSQSEHKGEPWVDAHGNLGVTGGPYYIRDGSEKNDFSRNAKIITAVIFGSIAAIMLYWAIT